MLTGLHDLYCGTPDPSKCEIGWCLIVLLSLTYRFSPHVDIKPHSVFVLYQSNSILFSYGNRDVITMLLLKLRNQNKEQLKARRPGMAKALKKLGDYVIDLR